MWYHGTNSFLGGRTTLEDFEARRGDEMLQAERGNSALAGVLEVARDRYWEVLPVVDLHAMPGPTVANAVVGLFWAKFRVTSRRRRRTALTKST